MQWTGITSTIPLMTWATITPSQTLSTPIDSTGLEWYYVKLPCSPNLWFKIKLFDRDNRQTAHYEMFDQTRGSIYCNGGGNWYGGVQTVFTLQEQPLCEHDNIKLLIIKTNWSMGVRNNGRSLFSHRFRDKSWDRCRINTAKMRVSLYTPGQAMDAAVADRT